MSRFDFAAEDRKKERERKAKREIEEADLPQPKIYRSRAFADIIRVNRRGGGERQREAKKIRQVRQAGQKSGRRRIAGPLKITGKLFTIDKSLDMPGNLWLDRKFLRLPKNVPLEDLFKKLDDFDTAMEPMDKGFAARDALKEIERVFNVHEPTESEKKFYEERKKKDAEFEKMKIEGTLLDKFMLKLKSLLIAISNNPYDRKINGALNNFSKDFKEWWNERR